MVIGRAQIYRPQVGLPLESNYILPCMKAAFIFLAMLLPGAALAQVPAGYYNGTQGLSGSALQSALHNIIDNHTVLSYTPGVWDAYYTTDKKPGSGTPGKVWTIYSDRPGQSSPYEFTLGDQCGSSSPNVEGNCYNREHVWPRTYFGGQVPPMNTDLWIVYPTDYWVNSKRGNLPYGRVTSATFTSQNGSKVGAQAATGAPSGQAFEPIDSFKGDIARSYFYVATRYLGEDGSWDDWEMANGAVLKPWAVQMLLQWHALDPVSQKERLRNNAVYAEQGNRNPFIDSPGFVQCIWGVGGCAPAGGVEAAPVAGFSIAPNPATGAVQVTIPAKNGMLELLDMQGRIWMRREVDEAVEVLDVAGFPRGVWMIKIRDPRGVAAQRIVLH